MGKASEFGRPCHDRKGPTQPPFAQTRIRNVLFTRID